MYSAESAEFDCVCECQPVKMPHNHTEVLVIQIGLLENAVSNMTVKLAERFEMALSSEKSLAQYLEENFEASHLSDFTDIYQSAFTALGVTSRAEFLRLVEDNQSNNEQVKVKGEQLHLTETHFELLLKRIDEQLKFETPKPPDAIATGNVLLTDCESGIEFTLHSFLNNRLGAKFALIVSMRFFGCPICMAHLRRLNDLNDKFASHSCSLVVICKGTKDGGVSWKRRSGLEMPILADEKGHFVPQFSFGRSIWDCFRPEQLGLTMQNLQETERTFSNDVWTDFFQAGGDVLMDKNGKVLFCHHSHMLSEGTDETHLLNVVQELNSRYEQVPMPTATKFCCLL